jgi:hypothetical protein
MVVQVYIPDAKLIKMDQDWLTLDLAATGF